MTSARRVPSDLYGPVLWSGLLGTLCLLVANGSAGAWKPVWGGIGLVFLGVAVALLRLRPWARVAAGTLFSLALAAQLAVLVSKGFNGKLLFYMAMNAWWAVYMFRPSTRRIFEASGAAAFDVPGCATQLLSIAFVLAVGVPFAVAGLPFGWAVAGMLAVYALYAALLEKRVERALRRRLATRPPELDDEAWARFRRAQDLRAAGDVDGALDALAGLSPAPCVRALQGLLFLARPDAGGPLRRFVFDSDYAPDEEARETMVREARDPSIDLEACVQERAEVVDALLADAFSKRPLFVQEADAAIQRITGRVFVGNEEYAHREAWAAARPLCTGTRGRTWLVLRLWERMAQGAAEGVAEGSADVLLREATGVSRRFAEGAKDGTLTQAWVEENAHALGVLPMFADAFRLHHLDLPYLERYGAEAVTSRILLRLELVALLRRLRDDYPAEAGTWTAMLLALLAGQSRKLMLKKKRFDPWWAKRRESQATFDARFAAGLRAAAAEDWAAGAAAFEEAAEAWPERACARHNHAACLLRDGRAEEAEGLFETLTAEEADEPLYWLRLGDARRARGKSREALTAYRTAAKLGGLEQAAAVRLGLLLADEGREDEAMRELDAAAGPEPSAETLEGLADFLEEEGVFGLAHHYRQKALGERLSDPEEDDGADPAGSRPSPQGA